MSNSQMEPMVPITVVREVPVDAMMSGRVTLGQTVDYLVGYVAERAIVDPYSASISIAADQIRQVVGVQMVVMGRPRPEPVVTPAENGPASATQRVMALNEEMAQLQSGPALAD